MMKLNKGTLKYEGKAARGNLRAARAAYQNA